MSENILLKMGIEFAASLNMGVDLCSVLYIISYKSGKNELKSTYSIPNKWLCHSKNVFRYQDSNLHPGAQL